MGLRRSIFILTVIVGGLALVYQIYFGKEISPVLKSSSGDIEGVILKSRQGRPFVAYYGIPYAKPPVGNKRFESPEKFGPWKGTWDGTYFRPLCQQFDFFVLGVVSGSEDCLYLNVYVPKGIKPSSEGVSIIVDIHGGYFHVGSPRTQGPHFFMDHDVIVVTMAYRVGILGFLNTGDGAVRGNMGLKDQRLALQWIQENIRSFGGDPTRVTLMGESAGAASVQYHMISSNSKNLFSRAIRQSGSAVNYWTVMGLRQDRKQQATGFAGRVGCPTDTTKRMVECLKNMNANTLVYGHKDLMAQPLPQESKFVPSIEVVADEDSVISENPVNIVREGRFNRVPLLSGFNMDEGLLHSSVLYGDETKLNNAVDNWVEWAPRAFHYSAERTDISQKIWEFYFGAEAKQGEKANLLKNFTNVFGDRLFNYGILKSVEYERKYLPELYNYIYDHEGGFRLSAIIELSGSSSIRIITSMLWKVFKITILERILGVDVHSHIPGTGHGDDLALLWTSPEFQLFYSERKDLQLSKELVQLWVDFATAKKPLTFRGIEIPGKSEETEPLKFIRLSDVNPGIVTNLFSERLKFWETLSL